METLLVEIGLVEICIMIALVGCAFYYRMKYKNFVEHHRDAAIKWRKMMMDAMGEIVGTHFRGSAVSSYIVRLKDQKVEILIGDDDHLVAVDMEAFNLDAADALDEAYNRFVVNIR